MITSSDNPRLKAMRRLRQAPSDELALLEGPVLVTEAAAAGLVFEELLASPELLESADGEELRRLGLEPDLAQKRLLLSVADADAPRGLLAVVRLPRGGAETLPALPGLHLYLAGIQDPGNLGAVARTAEAVGAHGLALSPGTVHPNHPRALRASAGSLLRLPAARRVAVEELDARLAQRRPLWAGLVPREGADLYRSELEPPLVLALGAEGPGLTGAARRRVDVAVTIPLEPPVESLNVAVAAAVALFELHRRQTAAGADPALPLNPPGPPAEPR